MFRELEEIGSDKIQLAADGTRLGRYVHEDWKTHLRIYAIDGIGDEGEEAIAYALAVAVHQIAQVIRPPIRIGIVFGRFPYLAINVGTGVEVYISDQEHERSFASADDRRIYVDAFRIFDEEALEGRLPSTVILEELVHAWMLTKDENLTRMIVLRLQNSGYFAQALELTEECVEKYKAEHTENPEGPIAPRA